MPDPTPAEIQYRKRMTVFWVTIVLGSLAAIGSVVGAVVFFVMFAFEQLEQVPPMEFRVEGRELRVVPADVGSRERAVLLEISDVTGRRIVGPTLRYAQSWNRERRADGAFLSYQGHGIEGPRLVVSSFIPIY